MSYCSTHFVVRSGAALSSGNPSWKLIRNLNLSILIPEAEPAGAARPEMQQSRPLNKSSRSDKNLISRLSRHDVFLLFPRQHSPQAYTQASRMALCLWPEASFCSLRRISSMAASQLPKPGTRTRRGRAAATCGLCVGPMFGRQRRSQHPLTPPAAMKDDDSLLESCW